MLKFLLTISFIFAVSFASAQIPEYEYFPPSVCKRLGIVQITVYEIKLDSGKTVSKLANNIHIANNMVRELFFDTDGHKTRVRRLGRGGKIVEQELIIRFGADDSKVSEVLYIFHTNNADSTKLIQQRVTDFRYDAQHRLLSKASFLASGTIGQTREGVDSVACIYDQAGTLIRECTYDRSAKPKMLLEQTYYYTLGKTVVNTQIDGVTYYRDEYELDKKGRIILTNNYGPGDSIPRLQTRHTYDSHNRLIETNYLPDWGHFPRGETEISRANKFDSYGKLVEVQITFGDGKRVLEFYDAAKQGDEE